MNPGSLLLVALRPLFQRPVRTLLLLQGTIWGVAVAVFPSAVIEGTRQAALTEGALLGADRIAVAADPTALEGNRLVRRDVRILQERLAAAGIDTDGIGALRVVALKGARGEEGALVEADPGALQARRLELAAGRWPTAEDPPDTCFLEARAGFVADGVPPVPGDVIAFEHGEGGERELRVVGVARPRSPALLRTNDLGFDVTHPMYRSVGQVFLATMGIPSVDDAWKRSDAIVYVPPASEHADWIVLRVETTAVREAAAILSTSFADQGRSVVVLRPLLLPFILGRDLDRFLAVRTALFLACLVMGAVVMANLGLLTVLRRTREIAIRRVEGATRASIALQFLVEGLVLTAIGCVVGWLLGMGLAMLRVALEPVTGFRWVFPWRDALLVGGVALLIGVSVSILPALRAARQQPVKGLAGDDA